MDNKYCFYKGYKSESISNEDSRVEYIFSILLRQLFTALDKHQHAEAFSTAINEFIVDLKKNPKTKAIYLINPLLIENMRNMTSKEEVKAFAIGIPLPSGEYISYAHTI